MVLGIFASSSMVLVKSAIAQLRVDLDGLAVLPDCTISLVCGVVCSPKLKPKSCNTGVSCGGVLTSHHRSSVIEVPKIDSRRDRVGIMRRGRQSVAFVTRADELRGSGAKDRGKPKA